MKQNDYDWESQYYDVMDGSHPSYGRITKQLLSHTKGPKVLDMACGTGNFTIEIKRLGYDVEGADLSQGMMRLAKRKVKGTKFFTHDMRKPLRKKYDTIMCMFNAVGHLTPAELETTLRNFRKSADYVVFDIFNHDFMDKNWIHGEWIDQTYDKDGLKIVRFNKNTLDRKRHIMNINQRIYIQKDRKLTLKRLRWQMQIYTKDELLEILGRAGWRPITLYTGLAAKKLSPFTKDSIGIIVVAKAI